jgi:hypothetical protein
MKLVAKCPHCGHDNEYSTMDLLADDPREDTSDSDKPQTSTPRYRTLPSVSTIAIAGGAIVAAPCVVAMALGFGTAGIVAGSAAAATQASIANVAAGSVFAVAQSLGATGAFASGATWGGVAAATGAGVKVAQKVRGSSQEHDETSDKEDKGEKDESTKSTGTEKDNLLGDGIECENCQKFFRIQTQS